MARTAQPLYLLAARGFDDFSSLMASGDLGAMKAMAANSEKWFEDPDNAKDPGNREERQRLAELRAEIARLESLGTDA